MPMTGPAMGAAIVNAVNGASGAPPLGPVEQAIYTAVGNAIVTYIQSNAQIPLGIAVATAGTATAQTGATTAPGTIV